MPGGSYRRRFRSLLMCSRDVFRALNNIAFVCWQQGIKSKSKSLLTVLWERETENETSGTAHVPFTYCLLPSKAGGRGRVKYSGTQDVNIIHHNYQVKVTLRWSATYQFQHWYHFCVTCEFKRFMSISPHACAFSSFVREVLFILFSKPNLLSIP